MKFYVSRDSFSKDEHSRVIHISTKELDGQIVVHAEYLGPYAEVALIAFREGVTAALGYKAEWIDV